MVVAGNVGIGTSSPDAKLDVVSTGLVGLFGSESALTAYVGFKYNSTTLGYVGNGSGVASGAGATDFAIGSTGARPLVFGTNDAERMRIDSAGNVGIGTSSGGYKLTVAQGNAVVVTGSADGTSGFALFDAVSGGNHIGSMTRQGNGIDVASYDQISFKTGATSGISSGAERMRINSAGNVGIGTTNPGYKLEVNGSFAATTKSFVIDHPTKPDMKLRYGSLEGPENGVYVRGRSKGDTIELPDYWTGLVDEFSITVNLTPIGSHQKLYVKSIDKNVVTIGGGLFDQMEYFYTVFAERKDVDKLIVEI
jgi:hypothetical protein